MNIVRRRDLVRGLGLGAAASLVGPFVRGIVREARGQSAARKNLVVHLTGNGFTVKRHMPVVRSETDFDLPPSLSALEPWKKNLTLITPLLHQVSPGLHGNGWSTLSCVPILGTVDSDRDIPRPGGQSIDRAIAQVVGKGDPFPSINLALYSKTLYGGALDIPHASCDGPNKEFPPDWNPVTAFDKIFAQPARAMGLSAQELLDRDRSVLDLVRGDIARLQPRLAGSERAKLDQMLDSLRGLEMQLAQRQKGASCQDNQRPTAVVKLQPEIIPEAAEGLVDVAAHAIACGMTRVVALSLHGHGGPDNPWPFLNIKNPHLSSHDGDNAALTRLEQYEFGRVAQLLQRLAAFRNGSGTLADQTTVMCLNAGGGEHHNGFDRHPVVLVGNAGGALRSGRAVILPPKAYAPADVFCAVATAVGAPMSTFGVPALCKGPLPGLLA